MNWPMEAMSLNGAVLTWQRHPGRAVRLCLGLPEHYTDPFSTMVLCTGSDQHDDGEGGICCFNALITVGFLLLWVWLPPSFLPGRARQKALLAVVDFGTAALLGASFVDAFKRDRRLTLPPVWELSSRLHPLFDPIVRK